MLSLDLSPFMVQLKEGTIHNLGGPDKSATVKLFDVAEAGARPFGDDRVKLSFADAEGNEVVVSLFPDQLDRLEDDLATLGEGS